MLPYLRSRSFSVDESAAGMTDLLHFDTPFVRDRVDHENAIIRGVSIITGGLVAEGHGLEVDDETLRQMHFHAKACEQVPVKIDHKSGAAAVCGYLTNFTIEGNKLKGDWHLLKSHPQREQILETAERMPGVIGMSAAFLQPKDAPKGKARCSKLVSVDYVTTPAANPDGMFSAKVDNPVSAMADKPNPNPNPEPTLADVLAVVQALTQKVDALQAAVEAPQDTGPDMEAIAKMSPEELAKIGLTPEDVQAALAEIEAMQGDSDGAGDDGVGDANATDSKAAPAVVGGSPAASAALEALQKQVVELSAIVKKEQLQKKQNETEVLFTTLESNIRVLKEENERLRNFIENPGKSVSPSIEQRSGIRFFSRGREEGEFEQLVALKLEEGKGKVARSVAFQSAIKENPNAYQDYLVRIGVAKPTE